MLLIKNGHIINPNTNQNEVADIIISEGVIQEIGKNLAQSSAGVTIYANGMMVAPGLVDTHAHFREPGGTHKEDILSGARAAAKGGYTTVVMMANTNPAVDNIDILRKVLEKGKKTDINIASCANVTYGMRGKEIVDMLALADVGAAGFTDDGKSLTDEELVRSAMEKAAKVGKPISLHEEDPDLVKNPGINKGYASSYFQCQGAAREAENKMVKRDLDIAQGTGATVIIQHVSTKEAVELIRQAKMHNPLIHAEATPHHFSLTEEALIKKGANAKVNPPLRAERDRLAIIEGIKDGTLDIIATDHAPHTEAEKSGKVIDAPSGMIGLETALSLGIRELVNPGHLSYMELIQRMSTTPAQIYDFQAGDIRIGNQADLVIFDPRESWTVKKIFQSKSSNSPFVWEIMPGVVRYTICNGEVVYI